MKLREVSIGVKWPGLEPKTDIVIESSVYGGTLPFIGLHGGVEWVFEGGWSAWCKTLEAVMLMEVFERLVEVGVEGDFRLRVEAPNAIHGCSLRRVILEAAAAASAATRSTIEVYGATLDPVTSAHVIAALVFTIASPSVPREPLSEALRASGIILCCMPLAAAYHALTARMRLDSLGAIIEELREKLRSSMVRRGARIVYTEALDPQYLRALLYAGVLNRFIESSLGELLCEELGCSLEVLEDRGLYIHSNWGNELLEVAERLCGGGSLVNARLVLSGIEEAAEVCMSGGSCPLSPVLREMWPEESCELRDVTELVEHAGLAPVAVEYSIDEYGVAVRYRPDCWQRITQMLEKLAGSGSFAGSLGDALGVV